MPISFHFAYKYFQGGHVIDVTCLATMISCDFLYFHAAITQHLYLDKDKFKKNNLSLDTAS